MNDKLEETVHDIKTPGLNKPETYVLTDERFNTYLVLIFSELKLRFIKCHIEKVLIMKLKYL